MSYVEILVTVIITGIIIVSLTIAMSSNELSTAESIAFERAVTVAKGEIFEELTGQEFAEVEGYTVTKEIPADQNYVKVKVNWSVLGDEKEYTLYGTIPDADYND